MRNINWESKLSDEDIAWVRQAGFIDGEDRLRYNAEQYGTRVSDPESPDDEGTRSTVGLDAVGNPLMQPDPATGAPRQIDPANVQSDEDTDDDDDYDSWTKGDLEVEVTARNDLSDTSNVEVVGTGANGNVLKEDLIKALRLWDQDNPEALKD